VLIVLSRLDAASPETAHTQHVAGTTNFELQTSRLHRRSRRTCQYVTPSYNFRFSTTQSCVRESANQACMLTRTLCMDGKAMETSQSEVWTHRRSPTKRITHAFLCTQHLGYQFAEKYHVGAPVSLRLSQFLQRAHSKDGTCTCSSPRHCPHSPFIVRHVARRSRKERMSKQKNHANVGISSILCKCNNYYGERAVLQAHNSFLSIPNIPPCNTPHASPHHTSTS